MDSKNALINSIERIKEKITLQEYEEILENLEKLNVIKYKEKDHSGSGSGSGSGSEADLEIPNKVVKVWNGTEVIETNLRALSQKPLEISVELATFFKIPTGVLISENTVIKEFVKYTKQHNLQNIENKRIIDLDKPGSQELKTLLRIKDNETLTFFNLNRYLRNAQHIKRGWGMKY